jgi:hypothetical protein
MEKSFFSNTCLGLYLFQKFDMTPYNNPFIGTLIQNDLDYIKFVNNLSSYVELDPVIGDPLQKYYEHPGIVKPYPVIFLGDVEIHCIHEHDNTTCLEKFLRRLKRFRTFLQENKDAKIFALLSFSELLNDHDNICEIIDEFLKPSANIIKIFLGPTKYNVNNRTNYINIDTWDNVDLSRDEASVYKFNNQTFTTEILYNYIKNLDS